MGNILFPCSSAPSSPSPKKKPESFINLSESCIERLTREESESGKRSPGEELNIEPNVTEREWMMKLKCLDDAHSNTYGLTVQAFYKLADQVDSQIEPIRPGICNPEEVIQCLKRNTCCSIRCMKAMEKYIDCIDVFRINIIKEKIECELKEKRKEDHEIVEQFLKNENGKF